MPNWTTNILNFDTDVRSVLLDEKGKLSFNDFIPQPTTKEECPDRYIVEDKKDRTYSEIEGREWFDWWHWNVHHWGTKWDVDNEHDLFVNENGDCIEFNTAWEHPAPIFVEMSKRLGEQNMYVESCYETGEVYTATYNNGEILSEEWSTKESEEE